MVYLPKVALRALCPSKPHNSSDFLRRFHETDSPSPLETALIDAISSIRDIPSLSPDIFRDLLTLSQSINPATIPSDYFAILLPKLPNGPLELLQPVFDFLDFWAETSEICLLIFASGYLQRLDFTALSSADPSLQKSIYAAISRVISQVDCSAAAFPSSFVDALMWLCLSGEVWRQMGLPYVITVAGQFVELIGDVERLGRLLYDLFILFIHHTQDEVQIPALAATCRLLRSHPEMGGHRAFGDERLYDRLEFLGGQKNHDLTESVVALLTTIMTLRELSEESWRRIARLTEAAISEEETRQDGLVLFACAIAQRTFTAIPDLFEGLLERVLTDFDGYRGIDKLEVAGILANCLGYLREDVVETILADERFVEVLEFCLGIDDDHEIVNLLNGLYAGLEAVARRLRHDVKERIITAVNGVMEFQDAQKRNLADLVLRRLSQG
jgi:hypothetical protein